MDDEGDRSHELAQQIREALDDDFTAALEDPAHAIVEQVRAGTLTRAEAESWALEQGRPPFASRPDTATFELRGKRNWTLAQMAAWAIWRTDDAVRAVSEEYASRCVEWVEAKRARVRFLSPAELEFTSPTDRVGYELGSPKVASAGDVLMNARHQVLLDSSAVAALSPEQAAREILDALQAGDPLVARHGEGETIDHFLWDVLSPFTTGDGSHDAVLYPSGNVVRFHRVRVERDAVLAVWPLKPDTVAVEDPPVPVEGAPVVEVVAELVDVDPIATGNAPAAEAETLAGPVIEAVASTSGSKPQIKGDRLRAMMGEPPMDNPNSDGFLSEARRRATMQNASVDQHEVRVLYIAMHGKKGAGRPLGRKSAPGNPVK